jgi:epsilon-lactone hydrolase
VPASDLPHTDISAIRALLAAKPRPPGWAERRQRLDEVGSVWPAAEDLRLTAVDIDGLRGEWSLVPGSDESRVLMFFHGGGYCSGSILSHRRMVTEAGRQGALRTLAVAYRLAPEHPFPAALEDAEASYRGLIDRGLKIALTGDSAGGNLALSLLSIACAKAGSAAIVPRSAVVLSPVTDLALTGESFETRAEADPYFIRSQVAGLVRSYLGESDPRNPSASPLYGDLAGLPPVRVHVGDDEVLLDDSRRYVERAVAAGVDARLDVWMGMPHGFVNGVGNLHAANQALRAIGAFLSERL